MNVSREQYDAIVVGVGDMGSATVYRLAERGFDVLGIERFDVPHARGSSHGSTRIVRLTQPEDRSPDAGMVNVIEFGAHYVTNHGS